MNVSMEMEPHTHDTIQHPKVQAISFCCCRFFLLLLLRSFVPSSTDSAMCVRCFFASFTRSPPSSSIFCIIFSYFLCALSTFHSCVCATMAYLRYTRVLDTMTTTTMMTTAGPRSVTRRTEQQNVLKEKKQDRKISLRWHKVTSRLGFGRPLNAITAKHTRDDHVHKCDYAWYYILHVCVFWTFFSAFFLLLLLFRCENRLQYYKAGTSEAIRAHARTTTATTT